MWYWHGGSGGTWIQNRACLSLREELEIRYSNLRNKDLKLWETMEVPFGNGKTWAKI